MESNRKLMNKRTRKESHELENLLNSLMIHEGAEDCH